MYFLIFFVFVIVLPILVVVLFVKGVIKNLTKPFHQTQNVKHKKHFENPITEVNTDNEITYSEEDIIDAEFEEIEVKDDKNPK